MLPVPDFGALTHLSATAKQCQGSTLVNLPTLAGLGAAEFRLSAERMIRLDAVSSRPPIYLYWHHWEEFAERNPSPVTIAKY
jgi:hypothetical protein